MYSLLKIFIDFVPRIEKDSYFDNLSDELFKPTESSPVYSTPPCTKLVITKASDFFNKNAVAKKPYVLFSEKIIFSDTTKPLNVISLHIPFKEQPTTIFNKLIPMFSNTPLNLDYFEKIYSKDPLVLSNLDSLKKQYISLCEQFDIDVTDVGFDEFINKRYSSLS